MSILSLNRYPAEMSAVFHAAMPMADQPTNHLTGMRLGRSIEAPKPAFERRERRGGRDDRRGGRRDFNRGERRAPRQEGGNR